MKARLTIALGILVLLSAVGLFALIVWPTEAPETCEPAEPQTAAQGADLEGDIRVFAVCEAPGRLAARVFVVDELAAEDPARAARRCAGHFIERHEVVTCYAFADAVAFEAAGVAPDGSAMERECWTSWFEQTSDQGGRGILRNEDYEAEGCP